MQRSLTVQKKSHNEDNKIQAGEFPLGLAILSGRDTLDFIQRMSTNNVAGITDGEGITTVFTTDRGRMIDVVDIYFYRNMVYMLYSKDAYDAIWRIFEKYVIMDDVTLMKEDGFTLHFHRDKASPSKRMEITPQGALMFGAPRVFPDGYVSAISSDQDNSLSEQGYFIDVQGFNRYRIERNIPLYNIDFSDEYNPLECGLREYISWTKGCYIGQEVIARLDTYGKLKRYFKGIIIPEKLSESVITAINGRECESRIIIGEKEIAHKITSVIFSPAYQKTIGLIRLEKHNPAHNSVGSLFIESREYNVIFTDHPILTESEYE
jgi:tRNA-modifying protein YgfZ